MATNNRHRSDLRLFELLRSNRLSVRVFAQLCTLAQQELRREVTWPRDHLRPLRDSIANFGTKHARIVGKLGLEHERTRK